MSKPAGVKRFLKNECGATAIEYAMGASFIAVAIVGGLGAIGTTLEKETFAKLNDGLITASISTEVRQSDEDQIADPILTGSTESAAAFEVEEEPVTKAPASFAIESEAEADVRPPIYTASTAAASTCEGPDTPSSCSRAFGNAIFDGWKGTTDN